MLLQRLTAGCAAAALAQAASSTVLTAAGVQISWALHASHFLAILAFHVPAALALAGWRGNRPWAAAAFFFPVAAARLRSLAAVPSPGICALVVAAALAFSGAVQVAPRLASPWATAPPGIANRGDAPSLVLVVLDTVRADHLGLYGYRRDTMPALGRFAREEGIVSPRSVANGASSLISHASIFTGLYPPRHGTHNALLTDDDPVPGGYPLDREIPTLAELLREAGYWTVGISANYGPLAQDKGLSRGFTLYDASPSALRKLREWSPWADLAASHERLGRFRIALERIPPFSRSEFFTGSPYKRAAVVTDLAIDVLDASEGKPLFLFLNYFDAHEPYYPPAGFRDLYPGRDPALGLRGLDPEPRAEVLRGERNLRDDEREHLEALYDGELTYTDSQLARLFERLRRDPRWEDMLVIITSDHGEGFGEHGSLSHSFNLYEEEVWVPLIVRLGRSAGTPEQRAAIARTLRTGMFQSADILPSMLSYAGVEPPADLDGVAWGRGRDTSLSWLYVFHNHATFFGPKYRRELRSVHSANWKLIESNPGSVEVYDLERDPGETRASAALADDRRRALLGILEAVAGRSVERDGTRTAMPAESMERLRNLGYVE